MNQPSFEYFYCGFYQTNEEGDGNLPKKVTDIFLRDFTSILHPLKCDFYSVLNSCEQKKTLQDKDDHYVNVFPPANDNLDKSNHELADSKSNTFHKKSQKAEIEVKLDVRTTKPLILDDDVIQVFNKDLDMALTKSCICLKHGNHIHFLSVTRNAIKASTNCVYFQDGRLQSISASSCFSSRVYGVADASDELNRLFSIDDSQWMIDQTSSSICDPKTQHEGTPMAENTDILKCNSSNKISCQNGLPSGMNGKFQILDIGEDNIKTLSVGRRMKLIHTGNNQLIKYDDTKTPIILSPLEVPFKKEILSVGCGIEHALVLTKDHQVWTVGNGSRAQLGLDTILHAESLMLVDSLDYFKVQSLAVGGWHNLILTDEGDIYGWGWNESGQVGALILGDSQEISDPSTNAKLYFTPTLVDTPLTEKFIIIAAGCRHSAAITQNGDLFTWGYNGYGQLCHENSKDCFQPTKVTFFESYYVTNVICGEWSTLVTTKIDCGNKK